MNTYFTLTLDILYTVLDVQSTKGTAELSKAEYKRKGDEHDEEQ